MQSVPALHYRQLHAIAMIILENVLNVIILLNEFKSKVTF